MKRLSVIVAFFCFIVFFSGCSTVKVATKVQHPSEIDMTPYTQVAVMDITGNYGKDFFKSLKSSFTKKGGLAILNCAPIKRKVETIEKIDVTTQQAKKLNNLEKGALAIELFTGRDLGVNTTEAKTETKLVTKISYIDEPNPNCTDDKLISSAIIKGNYNGAFSQNVQKKKSTCEDKNKKEYVCYQYTRDAILLTSGSIDVIDADSSKLIRSQTLADKCTRSTRSTDSTPAIIDENDLKRQCMHRDVARFMKTVTPWTETVMVAFKKDSDLPQLETGIKLAKMGKYFDAVKVFQEAVKTSETNMLKPKVIAKAYWDLGLAYEYSWQFDKAMNAFDAAYALHDDDMYLSEKTNVKKLMANHKTQLSRTQAVVTNE